MSSIAGRQWAGRSAAGSNGSRRADIDRSHHPASVVADRYGNRTETDLQLLVDHGIALLPNLGDFLFQQKRIGQRPGRMRLQLRGGEDGIHLGIRKRRQQHPAHRRAIGRQPRPRHQIDRHDPLLCSAGDVDDFGVIEDRSRGAVPHTLGQLIEMRLQQNRQRRGRQPGMADPQDLRRQREELPVIVGIAEFREREQAAPGSRPVQPADIRGVGDAQPLTLGPKASSTFNPLAKPPIRSRSPTAMQHSKLCDYRTNIKYRTKHLLSMCRRTYLSA